MPYGDLWRLHRRLMQQYLNSRAVVTFRPHQLRSTQSLLDDLLQNPNEFWKHIKRWVVLLLLHLIKLTEDFTVRFSASSVLSATYGYSVEPENDPLVKLNTHAEEVVVKPGPPGATLVDFFPIRMSFFSFPKEEHCKLIDYYQFVSFLLLCLVHHLSDSRLRVEML